VAKADEEAVLKAWEGLGYYTRARNLHATAKLTGGSLPDGAQELKRLPGIGRSTAAAIACFAYEEAVPILDANVRRILYRFFRRRQADTKSLWRMAERLFDAKHPYEYNQAMMDIGSTICTPKAPRCAQCPLALHCRGRHDPARYPAPKPSKPKSIRKRTILIYADGERYGLQKGSKRLLGDCTVFLNWKRKSPERCWGGSCIITVTLPSMGRWCSATSGWQRWSSIPPCKSKPCR
jgi:A/G-specific adenine glycosylase